MLSWCHVWCLREYYSMFSNEAALDQPRPIYVAYYSTERQSNLARRRTGNIQMNQVNKQIWISIGLCHTCRPITAGISHTAILSLEKTWTLVNKCLHAVTSIIHYNEIKPGYYYTACHCTLTNIYTFWMCCFSTHLCSCTGLKSILAESGRFYVYCGVSVYDGSCVAL